MDHYIYYFPQHPILYKQVLDGCLEKYNVTSPKEFDVDSDLRMLMSKDSEFDEDSSVEVIPVSLKYAEFRVNKELDDPITKHILNSIEYQFGTKLNPYFPMKHHITKNEDVFIEVLDQNNIESSDKIFYKKILLGLHSKSTQPSKTDEDFVKYQIAMKLIDDTPEMLFPENFELFLLEVNQVYRHERLKMEVPF